MRRLVLSAFLIVVCAATAGAVVQGHPELAYVTNYSGTVAIRGGPALIPANVLPTSPTGVDVSAELSGAPDDNTLQIDFGAIGDWIEIDFRFSSPQTGYMGPASGGPNLSLFLGDTTNGSVSAGSLIFDTLWYDTSGTTHPGTFPTNVNMTFYAGPPPVTWTASLGVVNYQYAIAGPSGAPIYGLRMRLRALAANTTFYFDAIQNPEPGTIALFALGIGGLGFGVMRRRKKKNA